MRSSRGFRRLGLTGTRWLVESGIYQEKLTARGLQCLGPNADERHEINRIIMDELVNGLFTSEAVNYFQRVVGRMKSEGCDAVILGCTEIPLILNDAIPVANARFHTAARTRGTAPRCAGWIAATVSPVDPIHSSLPATIPTLR